MTLNGTYNATNQRIALVAGRFNAFITEQLIAGARDAFVRHGGREGNLPLVWVPGAFEIPLAAKVVASRDDVDGVVCLGAVIRGATPHFDYVAAEVSKGIAHLSLELAKPILFGVLTTDTIEQAIERAGTKAGNKGFDTMTGAIEMVDLLGTLQSTDLLK